jgi:hypothetical protein
MKVYVHYEAGPSDNDLTLKLTLPKKWMAQPISQVLEVRISTLCPRESGGRSSLVDHSVENGALIGPFR